MYKLIYKRRDAKGRLRAISELHSTRIGAGIRMFFLKKDKLVSELRIKHEED